MVSGADNMYFVVVGLLLLRLLLLFPSLPLGGRRDVDGASGRIGAAGEPCSSIVSRL